MKVMELFTDEEKALLKQYGDYMKSVGFYSTGGEVNCWRFKYSDDRDSFWTVDLYCDHKFSPSIYQFKWNFDGINDPKLIVIQNGGAFNACYKPKTFDEFKK